MSDDAPELLLASRCCGQCLTTRNRIVSGARAAQIIEGCREAQNHFFCHKGSVAGQRVHCRGVHDILGGSLAYEMAQRFGIPIKEVDPEVLKASD
ncbi:hypothetical protein [Sphingomonas sp. 3-13AW]|uniref:hypothetical protein n=1 Tax=Sphingomonas sp. 3-13AW TaxID=3050450 RepID=UPI003BB74348